jgi:soluble lytic murein transglycosylase-like protein
MRVRSLTLALLACSFAVPGVVVAQTPTPGGVQRHDEQRTVEVTIAPEQSPAPQSDAVEPPTASEVFIAVGEAPAPKPAVNADAAQPSQLDPTHTVETITNSVLNANGGWDPTLGRLTTGDPAIDAMILESGARHGVDPKLVYAVMNQESTFKKNAVSPKGACGFMQLMPDTARRFGVTNIFDPKQNIDAGTRYLRFLLDLFDNNVELALAAYNAGEYRVIREGYRVPAIRETQNYVKLITARYYGRSKRQFVVTYGKSTLTEKERDDIRLAAFATQDDRGTDSLSNIY